MRLLRGIVRSFASLAPTTVVASSCIAAVVVVGACTTGDPEPDDGGNPEPAATDGGTPEDGGQTPEPPDAGNPEPPDSGSPEPTDGGDVPGACAIADPCGDAAATDAVTFDTGASTGFTINGNTFVIGTATRGEINTALGASVVDTTNPFRAYVCSARVDLRFVDDKNGDDFEGTATDGDILSRVLTMSGTNVTTTGGVNLSAARTAATAAMTAPTTHSSLGFDFDFDFDEGWSVRSKDGSLQAITVFLPQANDFVGMTFDAIGASLTMGNDTISTGSDMDAVEAVLGAAFDTEGVAQEQGFISVTARIYGAYGIRVGDACIGNNCSDVETFILSSPFLGVDSNGLGLGSTQVEVETFYGAVDRFSGTETDDDDNVHVYQPDANDADVEVGILFVKDSDCTKRVAAFVLPLVEAP